MSASAAATPATQHPQYQEYLDSIRWGRCGGPLPTFRQWLIESEAIRVHRERTGRGDPWPSLEDYATAAERVPVFA